MNPYHPQVAARAGYRCEYCHAPESIFNFAFEVEHVIPAVREGGDGETNLALSCRACNAYKSTRTESLNPDGVVARLFHPRQDVWERHFQVDAETGVIEGLTSVGRATISCLNMNSPAQHIARRQWIRLGLFP